MRRFSTLPFVLFSLLWGCGAISSAHRGDDGGAEEGGGIDADDERIGCFCVPGPDSWRVCDSPDFSLWGRQECGEDLDWGRCVEESTILAECGHVAAWYSPEVERCCIEIGFCCQDMWDLDHDGDTWESLGSCDASECFAE